MNLHENVARAGAAVVTGAAVAGSTSALLRIGVGSELSLPVTLPLALDGAGLVAAVVIRRRRRDLLAWAVLAGAVATSAAAQWMAAPAGGLPHLAHVSLPLAALLTFELFLRAVSPVPAAPGPEHEEEVNVVVPGLVGQPPRLVVADRPAPVTAADLVPLARKLLAELDLSPHAIGRPRLVELLRGNQQPVGTRKATALLALLREEDPT